MLAAGCREKTRRGDSVKFESLCLLQPDRKYLAAKIKQENVIKCKDRNSPNVRYFSVLSLFMLFGVLPTFIDLLIHSQP